MDIWFFRINDSFVLVHVSNYFMSLDRILSLVMVLSLIIALIFIAMILYDLNDLWVEVQYLWETSDNFMEIIKEQQEDIKNLQILYLRKEGISL
tara:strand:- start:57 stop:338 length:282 start_codon:yes stop_codon:yes gene_type:complete